MTVRWLLVAAFILIPSGPAQGQTGTPPESETKLLPSDGEAGDSFGFGVSLSGDTALVGAAGDDDNGFNSGSAYVFLRSDAGWSEQAKLIASDGEELDIFGRSVSISADTALIGASHDDDNGTGSGSAYVFVRSGNVWSEQAKLLARDGAAHDRFGWSVSILGDTALVGADSDDDKGDDSGSAYIFGWGDAGWTQQGKLRASDGAVFDFFGASVSLSADSALVGAPFHDGDALDLGSAYVFVRHEDGWIQQAELRASDGERGDHFGASVSIYGDTALVGASGDDDNGIDSGSAYVFVRDGTVWTQQAKLRASEGESFDHFGDAVSLSTNTALVGAWAADENGSAYLFERHGTAWTEQEQLLASDGAIFDFFGDAVSLSGNTSLVGAWQDDDNGEGSGSAYVFAPSSLDLSVAGTCPGPVTVTISNAPPNSEVGVIAAANNHGSTKGGAMCKGTLFEIGEPFQVPPLWIVVDRSGGGSGAIKLQDNRCWMEALALADCSTSGATRVP